MCVGIFIYVNINCLSLLSKKRHTSAHAQFLQLEIMPHRSAFFTRYLVFNKAHEHSRRGACERCKMWKILSVSKHCNVSHYFDKSLWAFECSLMTLNTSPELINLCSTNCHTHLREICLNTRLGTNFQSEFLNFLYKL